MATVSSTDTPYTLLESILIRRQELEQAGVPVEHRFAELKSHVTDLLDVVKDYQVFTLDQFIHAAHIAVNNVQDVRLYSLEARIDALQNSKVGLGQLLLEIFLIATIELAVGVSVPLLAAALPAVGALMYRMQQNSKVRDAIKEVASVEHAIIRRRKPFDAAAEGWLDAPPPGFHVGGPANAPRPIGLEETFEITSTIKRLDVTDVRDRAAADIARQRAERAMQMNPPAIHRVGLDAASQATLAKYLAVRGDDALGNSLKAFADAAQANIKAESAGAHAPSAAPLTPSAAITELIAELQRMKIPIVNETAYSRSVVRTQHDESTFFDDLNVANALIQLDDLYPRVIYAYDAMLSATNDIADRIEVGVWFVYLKANNLLWVRDATGEFAPGTDGVFFNNSIIATEEPLVMRAAQVAAAYRITGHDFTGIAKLTDQQAHYLFAKFACADIAGIVEFLQPYVIGEDRPWEELIAIDLPSAVDLPESNLFGMRDSARDARVRLLKLAVLVFFLRLEQKLLGQNVKSAQFGEELIGQPFKQVLDLLKPPVGLEPESSGAERPAEDPLRSTLKEMGFQTADDVTPELLLLQTEIRLLRLTTEPETEWRVHTTTVCDEIRGLFTQLEDFELTTEQQDQANALEELYSASVCNRLS